ncbi:MAG: primosomal protein N', partial [Chloroflexota bacterium]
QVPETRDVHGLIEAEPVLTEAQVALARWISDRYLSPLFDSLALMLPPGFERSLLAFYELASAVPDEHRLETTERKVVELVRRQSKASLREIERLVGCARAARITSRLVRDGLLVRSQELQRERVRPKMVSVVALAAEPAEALEKAALLKRRAPWQAAVLEMLAAGGRALSLAVVRQRAGASAGAAVRSLARKGLVSLHMEKAVRDPLSHRSFARSVAPVLTSWQEAAWRTMESRLVSGGDRRPRVFLLHGITGSGKTELYLRALETVVGQGKRGVVLVPEISLAPQTIERFASRFPGRVAVLHSRLSLGEQHDEWRRIKRGGFDVVVGPRSALFAPQPDLGLIVMDEEHDWSYKQDEQVPRYHARDVALRMSEMYGTVVIMGSATPDAESYYRGEKGEYTVLRLPERITPWGRVSLPRVEVVDMREELKSGNRSIFSRSLQEAMVRALSSKEQVIIFLNRRGSATFVQCRSCGHVLRCRRCTVSLTYHSADEGLVCHQCNSRYAVPSMCPECDSPSIRFLGIGTQRVEEAIREMFPLTRTLRWDRDISKTKHSDEEILERFLTHDADVLIGTQMIAKGLDMPLVTLVGV